MHFVHNLSTCTLFGQLCVHEPEALELTLMHNVDTVLFILLLADPKLVECAERRQDGSTEPR
jgi:hypothetical protein